MELKRLIIMHLQISDKCHALDSLQTDSVFTQLIGEFWENYHTVGKLIGYSQSTSSV